MKYKNGGAFRRALEDRLRDQSLATGVPLVRLRKMVAFDRFVVRLIRAQPHAWVVKGGLALQLRMGKRARTTKDIDMLLLTSHHNIHQLLVESVKLEFEDWFQFEIERPASVLPDRGGGLRFRAQSLLDGRTFERFHVDVGMNDPVAEPVEYLSLPALLEFAGIAPAIVPCYPLTQHLAEKIHAYTRPRFSGESSRVKDLVDILLIAEFGSINGPLLYKAIKLTFDARETHALPRQLHNPPSAWFVTFTRMASEVGLSSSTLSEAADKLHFFIDPILQGEVTGIWDPITWTWSS